MKYNQFVIHYTLSNCESSASSLLFVLSFKGDHVDVVVGCLAMYPCPRKIVIIVLSIISSICKDHSKVIMLMLLLIVSVKNLKL